MTETKQKPKIEICLGSSCFARGNSRNLETIEKYLAQRGLKDEVDLALSCSLCQGRCNSGPNLAIDGVPYGKVDPETLLDLLKSKFEGVRR
jgi:NADH:ubiquinone oxidoreductase subunit E